MSDLIKETLPKGLKSCTQWNSNPRPLGNTVPLLTNNLMALFIFPPYGKKELLFASLCSCYALLLTQAEQLGYLFFQARKISDVATQWGTCIRTHYWKDRTRISNSKHEPRAIQTTCRKTHSSYYSAHFLDVVNSKACILPDSVTFLSWRISLDYDLSGKSPIFA